MAGGHGTGDAWCSTGISASAIVMMCAGSLSPGTYSSDSQVQAPNRLANLVTAALEQAVNPLDWDRAAPQAASMLMQAAALN